MPLRAISALLLLLLVPLSWGAAADGETPRFSQLQLNLNDLNPAWWEGYSDASPADRQRFFSGLESELQRISSTRPNLASETAQLQRLTAELAKQADPIGNPPVTPAIQPHYSLNEWLQLISSQRQLALQLLESQQAQAQHNATSNALRKEIASLLLRYRDLSIQDAEKQPLALAIVRLQLELLAAQQQQDQLHHLANQLDAALAQVTEQVQRGRSRIDTQSEDRQRIESTLEEQNTTLEALSKQQASHRILQPQLAPLPELAYSLSLGAAELTARTLRLRMQQQLQLLNLLQGDPNRVQQDDTPAMLSAEIARLRNQLNRAQERLLSDERLSDKSRFSLLNDLHRVRTTLEQSTTTLRDAQLLGEQVDALTLDVQAWWESPLANLRSVWQSSGALLLEWMNYPLFNINQAPVSTFDILWMILIITAAAFISRQLRRLLLRIGTAQQTFSDAAVFTIGRILHYVIMAVATVVGLSSIGLDLSNVALVAGALSVGIGFGLQSIFNNFISGLILLFERPFKVGDLVELESGVRGRIRAINVRSTHINTWDNIDVLVPNSEFIGGRVTNYTLSDDVRRLHIPFGVAYGSDKNRVRQAALEAAAEVPYTLRGGRQDPDVWLINFGESSLDFELVVWIHHNSLPAGHNPTHNYLWAIETALNAHGIEIPFPQRDLHLRSVDGRILASVTSQQAQTVDVERSPNPSEKEL